MNAIEKHRKCWTGKTDEWLFERLDNELKQKIEIIKTLYDKIDFLRSLPHLKKVKGEEKKCCNGQTDGYRCADCVNVV